MRVGRWNALPGTGWTVTDDHLGYPSVNNYIYVPIPSELTDMEYFYNMDPVFRQAIEVHENIEGEGFESLAASSPTCIRVPIDLLGAFEE